MALRYTSGVPVPMPVFPIVWSSGLTFIAAGGDHGLAVQQLS
ncbi:hypothetical protein ABGB18_38855 [Nonomuraea sp. B12E4]